MTGTNLQACLPNQLNRLTVIASYGPDMLYIYKLIFNLYVIDVIKCFTAYKYV